MLSVMDIAEKLNVSVKTVQRWIDDGKITAYQFGRQFRVTEEDFEKFLEQSKVK